MAVNIPFPLPATGYALNSKVRVNLDFLVAQFNEFNSGTATWDQVSIGTANSLTGTLTFYNASNANYLTLKPGATSANTTFTLPTGVPSATGKYLTSTTAGVMSWSVLSETSSYVGNQALYVDGAGVIQEISNGSGNKVMVNSSPPSFFSLLGTADQITVTPNVGDFTLSTPQSIATTSDVTFNSLQVDGGSATNPGLRVIFSGAATNTGVWSGSGTELNLTVAGATRFSIDSTGLGVATSELRAPILRSTSTLKISTGAGSIVTIQALGTAFGAYTLTLPPDDGTSGDVLRTDGAGVLTWVSVSAAGGATTALDNLASVAINTSLLPGTDNSIDLGSASKRWVNVFAKDIDAGASGTAGTIDIYPTTASKGKIQISAVDNSGDTVTTVTNAAQAAARTYTIPDAGASADFVMTAGTQTIAGSKTFSSVILGPNGTAGNPTFSFSGDPDNGLYRSNTNEISLATGGDAKVIIGNAETASFLSVAVAAGVCRFRNDTASGTTAMDAFNADNTSGTSHATLAVFTGGSSSGDPFINLDCLDTIGWGIGVDNSASDTLIIYSYTSGSRTPTSSGTAQMTFDTTNVILNKIPKFAGTNTTGAGSAALGANSPATTNTAPYTWIQIKTSDGSTAYIPCWK